MYVALATTDEEDSKGSTRLHMDMADGVNIMVHSELRPDGSPGVAAWDLFRAEDADRLRRFLKRRFGSNGQHDPILSQQYYLDAQLRKELYDDYGIKSHRVYQRPGDAVFVPAGCAHQVCISRQDKSVRRMIIWFGLLRLQIWRIRSKLPLNLSARRISHGAKS
jgi:lysine-specific demethylase 3